TTRRNYTTPRVTSAKPDVRRHSSKRAIRKRHVVSGQLLRTTHVLLRTFRSTRTPTSTRGRHHSRQQPKSAHTTTRNCATSVTRDKCHTTDVK
ncbi:unnamed protein product, partial [Closterium sp. NIES-54]